MTLVSNTVLFIQCQLICPVFLIWLFSCFFLSPGNEQEYPQVDTHREKTVGAKEGSDGAEGYSGEGEDAQEDGKATKKKQEADEDSSLFETETEIETDEDGWEI